MLGKLLASTAVSAVMTVVYLTGGAWAANRWGYLDVLDPWMVAWFVVFLLLSVLMYGSFFIAIGAACSDLKDAQNLMGPAMMILMVPALTWTLVARAPQSAFAIGVSLFPPATPFLMLLRLALARTPARLAGRRSACCSRWSRRSPSSGPPAASCGRGC